MTPAPQGIIIHTTAPAALETPVTNEPLVLPAGPTILIGGGGDRGGALWYDAICMMADHPMFSDLPGPQVVHGKDVCNFFG